MHLQRRGASPASGPTYETATATLSGAGWSAMSALSLSSESFDAPPKDQENAEQAKENTVEESLPGAGRLDLAQADAAEEPAVGGSVGGGGAPSARAEAARDHERGAAEDTGGDGPTPAEARAAVQGAPTAAYSVLPFLMLLGLKCLEEHAFSLGVLLALVYWRSSLDKYLIDIVSGATPTTSHDVDVAAAAAYVAVAGVGSVLLLACLLDRRGTGQRLLLVFPSLPDEPPDEFTAGGLSLEQQLSDGTADVRDALRLEWVLGTALRVDVVAQVLCIGVKATAWLLTSSGSPSAAVAALLRKACWHPALNSVGGGGGGGGGEGPTESPRVHGGAPIRSWAGLVGLARRAWGLFGRLFRRIGGSAAAQFDRWLHRGSIAVTSLAGGTVAGPAPPLQRAGSSTALLQLLAPARTAPAGTAPAGSSGSATPQLRRAHDTLGSSSSFSSFSSSSSSASSSYEELRQRRRCLALIEAVVQCYRLLLPVPLWCRYYSGAGQPWSLDWSHGHSSYFLHGPTQ